MSSTGTCVVDFNVNDSAESLAAFIDRIESVMLWLDSRTSLPPPRIDMSACRYLGPDAAAVLGALQFEAKRTGRSLNVSLPSQPTALAGFCRFSGLCEALGVAALPEEHHPDNETIALRQCLGTPGIESERIIALIRRHEAIHEDEAEYLRQSFNEVVHNVVDHSKSPIGCAWTAKYFASKREVRVAIVDRGEGILRTLQRTHPEFRSASGAIRATLQGHHSAKSRDSNMGLGLSNLRDIVSHREGTLSVLSDAGLVSFSASKGVSGRDRRGRPFAGTIVAFTLKLGVPL